MSIKLILIVDDSPTERYFLSDLLGKNGYEVIVAENGEQAIEKAKNNPDLILMDVVMPGINGFQATRAISLNEETRHIPIIICTTKNQATDRVWGIRQGAKDYITKPVDGVNLLAKIKSLLDDKPEISTAMSSDQVQLRAETEASTAPSQTMY